jgi:hypothetical protein
MGMGHWAWGKQEVWEVWEDSEEIFPPSLPTLPTLPHLPISPSPHLPSPSYPVTWDSTTPMGQETFVPPKPQ